MFLISSFLLNLLSPLWKSIQALIVKEVFTHLRLNISTVMHYLKMSVLGGIIIEKRKVYHLNSGGIKSISTNLRISISRELNILFKMFYIIKWCIFFTFLFILIAFFGNISLYLVFSKKNFCLSVLRWSYTWLYWKGI